MSKEIKYPEWRTDTWWIVSARQQARWMRFPEPKWVGPLRLRFRVIREDPENYVLEVTHLDSSEVSPERAEVQLRKRDYRFVSGTIRLGGNEIPMGNDFIATLLLEHPPGVDMKGQEGAETVTRGPEERPGRPLTIRTYTVRSSTGGSRVSSPELPYHLRIIEENYSIELENWGKR